MNNPCAFPFVVSNHAATQTAEPGISILDYFAAKAPNKIPDWYNPIDSDLVKDKENPNFKVYRYFQWRWYYAKMMLKERENWLSKVEEVTNV